MDLCDLPDQIFTSGNTDKVSIRYQAGGDFNPVVFLYGDQSARCKPSFALCCGSLIDNKFFHYDLACHCDNAIFQFSSRQLSLKHQKSSVISRKSLPLNNLTCWYSLSKPVQYIYIENLQVRYYISSY
jgi:hypothetical protein